MLKRTLTPQGLSIFDSIMIILIFGLGGYWLFKNQYVAEVSKEEETKEDNSIFKILDPEANFDVTFANNISERLDNVKGIDEVREEIDQLIKMIKSPKKYVDAGAKLHKGILLCGKPGTGKTLIARQLAKALNVKDLKIVNGP